MVNSIFTLVDRAGFNQLRSSIGTKIVLPYLLLTLVVAGVGAFIVVRLVTASLQERFHNQLLDSGRVVSEIMVDFEAMRLEVLNMVAGTEGVPESVATGNRAALAARLPQLIANSNTDAVEILDKQGREIYGWQRPPNQMGNTGEERSGADFSSLPDVRRVLNGVVDEFGEKRILMSQTPYGPMLLTIGPVYLEGERVGAALVGTYIREMIVSLTETAAARVTLYDAQGNVIDTTLGSGPANVAEILQEPAQQYRSILTLLGESSELYPMVVINADHEVPLKPVQILGQEYWLAYGDWRVRGQSLGLFSVALPSNFIVSSASTSRNLLSLLFFVATIGVFALGFFIARRITTPLHKLVQTSTAVTQGDLTRRSGMRGQDEISNLAHSFDIMTDRLVERNRRLVEQASKLEAILDSTADGIIVVNPQGITLSANPAARQILSNVSDNFLADVLLELPTASPSDSENEINIDQAFQEAGLHQPRRYEVGNQVFSAVMAPVKTPDGEVLGTVIALRDISREVEAERLKDGFITSISHELRTPLTSIQGNIDLLVSSPNLRVN